MSAVAALLSVLVASGATVAAASPEASSAAPSALPRSAPAAVPERAWDLPGEVIWSESFDGLADSLQPRVDDPGIAPGTIGFTHTPPEGWTRTNGAFGGGVTEWRGWSFTTRDFWVDAENQQRGWFTRADGIIAVADSDEWADLPFTGTIDTSLATPGIDVAGHERLELSFDSHYRQENAQRATVTVAFDGGEPVELLRYDGAASSDNAGRDVLSTRVVLPFDVPEGAQEAVFSFRYGNQNNSWYWAIDDIAVAVPQTELPADAEGTTIHVISDIQGDLTDLRTSLARLNTLDPDARLLVMNGDIVSQGYQSQYDAVSAVLADVPHVSGNVLPTIGNHEMYDGAAGSAALIDRFLAFAGRDSVWTEQVVDGVPVLAIGTERYEYSQRTGSGPFLDMSDEQLTWLAERLDHWSAEGRPVLLFSHQVLPNTVSGTYANFYRQDFETKEQEQRFLEILGAHPNVTLFTSHTHWGLELGDWAVRKVVPGGDPRGFAVVNTGAITNRYGPSGDAGEAPVGGAREASGLRVTVHDDRVRVQGYDFYRDQPVQTIDLPAPVGRATAVEPRVDLTVEPRCVAGRVALAVRAVNTGDEPLDLVATTPYGSRTFTDVVPGRVAYVSLATRSAQVPAGEATVTLARRDTAPGATVGGQEQVAGYDATSC